MARARPLHLVAGSPWKLAMQWLWGADPEVWRYPQPMSRGDWMLTILDTRPRSFLCIDRVANDVPTGSNVEPGYYDEELLNPLIPVSLVAERLGWQRFPSAPLTLSGEDGQQVLNA